MSRPAPTRAAALPAAGWYSERTALRVQRYWDGSDWTGQRWDMPRTIFVSYSRLDEATVNDLVEDLQLAQLTAWRDTALGGGDNWWREILRQIRGAAVFLQAVSDNSRMSEPCRLERRYADALGVPVLPVQVGTITSIRTWDVSEHQVIDYREHDRHQVIRMLAGAMAMLVARRPPPNPLPAEPDAPYAYLRGLRERLDLAELNRREQNEILQQIRERLDTEVDAGALADLVQMLRDLADRPDAVKMVMSDVAGLLDRYPAAAEATRG